MTFASKTLNLQTLILILMLPAFLIILVRFVGRDTRYLAIRAREIEEKVNFIAGERLLVWETEQGILAVGYARRWREFLDVRSAILTALLAAIIAGIAAYAVGKIDPTVWFQSAFTRIDR